MAIDIHPAGTQIRRCEEAAGPFFNQRHVRGQFLAGGAFPQIGHSQDEGDGLCPQRTGKPQPGAFAIWARHSRTNQFLSLPVDRILNSTVELNSQVSTGITGKRGLRNRCRGG